MARSAPLESIRDTIAARATASGEAAIAIVRLSGPDAPAIAARIFHPDQPTPLAEEAGRLRLGTLVHPGTKEPIDQALAVLWKAPHSHTGEHVAEFHTHGSQLVVSRVLDACVAAGARLARPGEFSRRAFLNGKLDLAQAEAVCDLIHAQTEAAGRAALAQLGGGLSRQLAEARAALVPVVAELEACVDFPEEGLGFQTRERLGRAVDGVLAQLQRLLDSSRHGRFLRDGARVVLAGPPNAGKSSLFNLLLRRERALVTPHPGTTRDSLEAEIDLRGIPLTLVDTAGLRGDPEEIEALGIARTREELRAADLILFLVDATRPAEARAEYDALRALPHLVIANKCDLLPGGGEAALAAARAFAGAGNAGTVALSTADRHGFDALEQQLASHFGAGMGTESGALVTNRRHASALASALESLQTAAEGLASELSPEFIAVDLTDAIARLDAITGRQSLDEDVLDAIFSTFCLGK
ncbi:MAG: tRNA modification GTPase [Candidatus Sumerlaeota bacterium]|nr:tRNA modification GTPase [Candidatus Sumerlaeota bacterium]